MPPMGFGVALIRVPSCVAFFFFICLLVFISVAGGNTLGLLCRAGTEDNAGRREEALGPAPCELRSSS